MEKINELKSDDPEFETKIVFEVMKHVLVEVLDEIVNVCTKQKQDGMADALRKHVVALDSSLTYDECMAIVRGVMNEKKKAHELKAAVEKKEEQDESFGQF